MSRNSAYFLNEQGLQLSGYQKKLKTMKKKFFVLYEETAQSAARLEYYDNEKKFKSGTTPKRVIKLKNCYNINRRLDTKYDYVIALSTKDGGFGLVLESEPEMVKWLETLINLQRGDSSWDNYRPQYEYVWQVQVQKKGLAEEKQIFGHYHVCLTSKSVTFIRIGSEKSTFGDHKNNDVEILLTTIRRCGDSQCVFYMEVGRQSKIGAGELWMETETPLIAQNMHEMILSAMSAKCISEPEPMRKRSSSATEASKPINMLQRRQTQPEKNYNSPQSTIISYGRERCDSLPTRNRTSSECSNQSTTTSSSITIRNNTISGLRPHSYQRHSNSPPMNSTTGCSESEESSISVDEPDDTGSFISYRFNSRSSEGVIPEENTDELANSEIKCNEDGIESTFDMNCVSLSVPGITEEHYVSMAPVKNTKEQSEPNKSKGFKHVKSIDELKIVPSVLSLRAAQKSEIDFPEYTSDAISLPSGYEMDSQSTRPTRAYSIGSKMEHNKINKRLGNVVDSEQNTPRVRAFSVGSRAKIPRCDLQRAVLFPKLMVEQNFNSNNNVCSVSDVTTYNQMLNTNAPRDKKSTSAPLLIHKSHNSVDRMSDLMEIDFSKSAHITSNRMHPPSRTQFSKSVPSTTIRDQMKKYDIESYNNGEGSVSNCLAPSILSVKSVPTDNGYLEMKPVGGSVIQPKSTTVNSNVTSIPKMTEPFVVLATKNQSFPNIHSTVLSDKNEVFDNRNALSKNMPQEQQGSSNVVLPSVTEIICADSTLERNHFSPVDKSSTDPIVIQKADENTSDERQLDNVNATKLSNKYTQLTLSSTPKLEKERLNKDDYINIDSKFHDYKAENKKLTSKYYKKGVLDNGKLVHSISNEDYKNDLQNTGKKTHNDDSGYEILQMKSDSSLQSHKPLNRPSTVRKEKQCLLSQIRPRSTNSSSLMSSSSSSSSTLCGCTSSSTSCLNYLPTSNLSTSATREQGSTSSSRLNNTSTVKTQLNVTSRPPSVSSEHELYYASLDLPQCSTEVSTKVVKTDSFNDSPPLSNVNNSYAKIDFDHSSDSSSSSSKNLNV